MKKKLIRITTVAESLSILLKGQLGFMNAYYDVVGVSTNSKFLDQVGVNEKVKTIPVLMTRKITPFQDLKSLFVMYKVLKSEKPFIVHTHTPKAGLLGMIASYFVRIPNRLHTVAGLPVMEAKGFKRIVLLFVEKITYMFATKVYPNSAGLKEFILENNLTKENKIEVIGNGSSNGIDTSHFDKSLFKDSDLNKLKHDIGVKANDFVFLFVGRLVKDKGINELVSSFSEMAKTNNNLKLVLVGGFEHDLDPLLPFTLEEIKNNNQIISVGFKEDVRSYFCISNVFVFPSYREGFPNVVLQASSMELMSIVTDINGANEIITHKENGLIIPVKNQDKLKEAMLELYTNNANYQSKKIQARINIIEKYEQKFIWQELLKTYNKL